MTRFLHICALLLAVLMGGQAIASTAVLVCRSAGMSEKQDCPCPDTAKNVQPGVGQGPCCEVLQADEAPPATLASSFVEAPSLAAVPPIVAAPVLRRHAVRAPRMARVAAPLPSGRLFVQLRQLLI